MSEHQTDNDGVTGTEYPGRPGVSSQGRGRLQTARGSDRRRRENTVIGDESAVLSREKSAAAREDAAALREDAAHLREGVAQTREGEAHAREGAATSREQKIRAAETIQATSDNHMLMLKQTNERLVVATVEAQKLAEQVQAAKAELEHLAHHDVLTDLPNRMLLQDRLSQAIELARRQGRKLAVMFMDLDGFKHINDSLGHSIGDQLLESVAQRLVDCVRHSDTVSRQGGGRIRTAVSLH